MSAQSVLDPGRWRALPVILVGSFLSFLDFFIVNIALPAMRDDLRASASELQLVVAGYGIGFAASLITGGRLGDIFGRKRVFLLGLVGFTLTSALCGLSVSPTMLVASRVLQAVTAATLTPQVLAIIRVEFAQHERSFAIGLYGASMGFASIVAQVLGGVLVSIDLFGLSWRLIFLINIPIGLVAVILATWMLRESRGVTRPTLDLKGTCILSLALLLLIFPLVEGREVGWPAWSFAMLAMTVPLFYAAVRYQQRVIRQGRTPLVALHLLRDPSIAFGLIMSAIFFSGLAVFFVVLTIFFQAGFGYSAFSAGLMFLPYGIGFASASAVSGRVASKIGDRIINLGTLLMALGLAGVLASAHIALSTAVTQPIDPSPLALLFLIYGFGQGLAHPALITAVVGNAGIEGPDAGSAAGLFLTTAQSSAALGVAAIGDVFFSVLGVNPTAANYVCALEHALFCNFTLLVVTFLLARFLPLVGLRRQAHKHIALALSSTKNMRVLTAPKSDFAVIPSQQGNALADGPHCAAPTTPLVCSERLAKCGHVARCDCSPEPNRRPRLSPKSLLTHCSSHN